MHRRLKQISSFINVLLLVISALTVYAWSKTNALPGPDQIVPDIDDEPVQTSTQAPSFFFSFGGQEYVVQPMAEYHLRGVIVSHNNPAGIGDMYHTSASVDIRDLCVVWGENARTGIYKRIDYWSEPWTCNFYTNSREDFEQFNAAQLSNNHLLPATAPVQHEIMHAHIGDQVELSGWLVNYAPRNAPDLIRRTSLVRTDTGNGACEVIFVKTFRTLRRSVPQWHWLYDGGLKLLLLLGAFRIIAWIAFPYIDYRWG